MNRAKYLHYTLTGVIALVWMINGLFCKVLNYVPRHQLIVARILGEAHAELLTKTIGVAELFMAIWILSGVWSRWSAIMQIVIVGTMNGIEFFMAPDLLLYGRGNAVLALLLMTAIYWNEFFLHPQPARQ